MSRNCPYMYLGVTILWARERRKPLLTSKQVNPIYRLANSHLYNNTTITFIFVLKPTLYVGPPQKHTHTHTLTNKQIPRQLQKTLLRILLPMHEICAFVYVEHKMRKSLSSLSWEDAPKERMNGSLRTMHPITLYYHRITVFFPSFFDVKKGGKKNYFFFFRFFLR